MEGQNPHFYDFLSPENIICGIDTKRHIEAISDLCRRLTDNSPELDFKALLDAVTERENIMPTVVAPGLAVPHARIPDIDKLHVAMGTSREGIDFKMPGMPSVNIVILIITPKDNPQIYLQVLAALGKDFQNRELVEKVAFLETPGDVLDFFIKSEFALPDFIAAGDIMTRNPITLLETDNLEKAIQCFATRGVLDIPILDHEEDIRGVISMEDLLSLCLPEHLLWMNDLSPIMNFQPFAEQLRDDHETKIADFMRNDYVEVEFDTPAIQLAKIFLVNNVRQILVTRGGRLVGVANLQGFMAKIFWA